MEISYPDSDRLAVDGCRRLTGPSLVWSETGAILDVLVEDMEMEQVLDCWHRQLDLVLSQVNWEKPKFTHRRFENGFNFLIAAPIDQLYSAVLVLETAWYFCACELLELEAESRDRLIEDIREEMQSEKNDSLIELQTAAGQHGVDFLVDDDVVSIGHGQGSISYMVEQIPQPQQINWASVHDVPVAMITGTNGKSTSVRLLDGIARAAGQVSGVTSTDFVRVGDDVLDQGDYSGPGGARLLLRDPRLEVAFLEVARGGILRRGLPLRRARVALVTNVANDHLGQYGVNTLQALTETKFAVSKTLAENGVLVVNADDAGIVEHLAQQDRQNLCWFSLDKSNPRIQYQLHNRGRCCFIDGDDIVNFDGVKQERICAVNDIPMTINGAALHNVRNALGAVGVASAMEYTSAQMRTGLCRFNSDERDNPGRLNSFELQNSVHVIIDFAHNAHSVEAVTDTVRRMPAEQKWALFGSAGDRSDEEIAAIASGVCSLAPDHVVIAEIEPYLRGRALGEVGAIMKQACLQNGIAEERIYFAASPLAGVKFALTRMQAGDLGLFLVLSERDQVIDYVNSQ
jgi:folylpolyglutamate synthase/dihydropteroate synthase